MRNTLGGLDERIAAGVIAASGDIAMIIDRGGVIRDVAVSNGAHEAAKGWLDRRWADTVTKESRPKVEEMLRDAAADAGPRWREINYPAQTGENALSLRCIALNGGGDGKVIAIARDQRAITELQQRLIGAQQAVEREYQRLRDVESRYRLLFQLISEAVLVIEASTREIVEANPAALRLIGAPGARLVGSAFSNVFDDISRETATSLLAAAQAGRNLTAQERLISAGRAFSANASLFRQDRISHFLVRLSPLDGSPAETQATPNLSEVVERIPDSFIMADEEFRVVAVNAAFVDLMRLASHDQAIGLSLHSFLGRPDLDRNILIETLREHGMLRNFATVLRNHLGEIEDVDVSAVHVADADTPCFGFTIRNVRRAEASLATLSPELPRSVEELSQLIGRVTLKELVREATDLVERLCIEAALELTRDNRASAAEILGLSRQSLYSKLRRHGIAEFGAPS